MAVRGDSLQKSMSSYLIEQIASIPNIEVRLNTSVQSCSGEDRLQCVTLVDHAGGHAGGRCRAPLRVHRRSAADRLASRIARFGIPAVSWSPARI